MIEDIISGLIVGILLLLIERLLIPTSEKSVKTNKPIEIIEPKKIIIKEKVVYKSGTSNDNSNLIIFFIVIFMGVALVNYIKYYNLIHFIIVFMSTAIGIMAVGMAGVCIRRGLRFRKDLNIMLVFNMLSIVVVPFLVWQARNASEGRKVNIELLKVQITQTEKISVFGDMSISFFLIYQIIGLAIIIIYMLTAFISNIYLVSLINLNLSSKLRGMWEFLNRNTSKMASKPVNNIAVGIIFLVLGYLMVSGIMLDILNSQTIG